MSLGTIALRGTIGAFFVGHGTQKLFGWFDGHGIEGTGGFFESLGLRPGKRHAIAAGVAETAGGAMLAAGALTPVAGTILSSTMITAARTAHKGKGPWVTSGGWEYNVVLIAAATALAEHGPGRPSVDAKYFPSMKGPVWAAASLAAAGIGSYLATSERFSPPAPEEPAAQAEPTAPATDADRAEDGRFARAEAGTASMVVETS